MLIERTANAGVLLDMDGKRLLLDGVCLGLDPYLGTPEKLRRRLLQEKPDGLLFTHSHVDHCDSSFISDYLQNSAGPVLGPADIPYSDQNTLVLDGLTVTPVESRHIGKTDCTRHLSFVLQGSRCLWFMGDASVLQWQKLPNLPRPDVILAPYGFLMGKGWSYCQSLNPELIVVLHLPERDNDPAGLWSALEETVGTAPAVKVVIPAMGEKITLK